MTKILHRKDLEKSLDFEIELALITEPAENRRNMTQRYNPTTMGSAKSYPGLPDSWTSYVGGLLSIGGVDIGDDEKLIISNLKYIKKLGKLLHKTDSRVIANYLGWRAAKSGSNPRPQCRAYFLGLVRMSRRLHSTRNHMNKICTVVAYDS